MKQSTVKVKGNFNFGKNKTLNIKTIIRDGETGRFKRIKNFKNITCTAGAVALARVMLNEGAVANEGQITYGVVGIGITPPAAGDTTLDNEIARNTFSTTSRSGNTITFRVFFTTAEANGVLTEFGLAGEDASGAADSGTLFEHATISETKINTETLTVEAELSVTPT